MNAYEQKQEAKRERLERAAEKARAESDARSRRAMSEVSQIPLGQPILIGHHSEKRHRAALRRMDTNMRKSIEADERAKELARRADAIGTGGISSDDPDAVAKLSAELAEHTAKRDEMKRANAHYRKHKTMRGYASLSDEGAAKLDADIAAGYSWDRQPYPKYRLSNLGANIRRIEQRIAVLTSQKAARDAIATGEVAAPADQQIGTATIVQDIDENRVVLKFSARLSHEHYKAVRSAGFVWSRTRDAFVRQLNNRAVWSAEQVARHIADELAKATQ